MLNRILIFLGVVTLFIVGSYILSQNYDNQTPIMGDSFEQVVLKKNSQPTKIFLTGEEVQLQNFIKDNRIVVTSNYDFIPDDVFLNSEYYGKIVSAENTVFIEPKTVSDIADFPLIDYKAVLFMYEGDSYQNGRAMIVEVYYFDQDDRIEKIFTGEGIINSPSN